MATERKVLIRLEANVGPFVAGMKTAEAAVRGLTREIDTSNDRTAWLAQSILALGPALVPIGAAAVPVLSGLVTQMTLAAGAAGTAALAFNGVGDGLKAVNEYQLEPTVDNFNKLRLALDEIGPAGAEFVRYLDEIGPRFTDLQMVAREGMFPGVMDGIDSFLDVLPRVRNLVSGTAEAMGELTSQAGAGLAGEGFAEFFDYLERNAKPLLIEMGQTMGNFIEGIGAMMDAFEPLTNDFSQGFLNMSRSFADWSHGLEDSTTFQEFVAYIQSVMPQVKETLGALVDAFVALLGAAAPVGGAILHALEGLFDVLGAIFRSPAGPALLGAAAGISALARAIALVKLANASAILGLLTGAGRAGGKAELGYRSAAAGVGMLALSMTDLDEKAGVANAAMFGMMGMVAGPWGAAIGAGVGLLMDMSAASKDAAVRAQELAQILEDSGRAAARDSIVDVLDSEGILAAAEDLGLGLDTVTAAAMGNKSALAELRAEQARLKDEQRGTTDAMGFDIEGVDADGARESAAAIDWVIAALGGENKALDVATDSVRRKKAANDDLAGSYNYARESAKALRDELVAMSELLEDRATIRGYEAALDDAAAAIKEIDPSKILDDNGNINIDLEGGRAVQEQLDGIAQEALAVADRMKGSQKIEFLTRAREDMIDVATKLFGNRKRAEAFADFLGLVDQMKVEPHIDADTFAAMRKIGQVRYALQQLDGYKATTTVETVYTKSGRYFKDVPSGVGPDPAADGVTVPLTGMPYADRHPYMLADGEEVISNRHGQADRHRSLLKAINAGHLADGGTAVARRQASFYSPASQSTQRFAFDRALVDIRTPDGRVQTAEMRVIAQQEISSDRTYQRATGPRTTRRGRPE